MGKVIVDAREIAGLYIDIKKVDDTHPYPGIYVDFDWPRNISSKVDCLNYFLDTLCEVELLSAEAFGRGYWRLYG